MPEAFERGAVDYLSEPLGMFELRARIDRILGNGTVLAVPGTLLRLEGSVLVGPAGNTTLGHEEAALLRILASAAPERVSRDALRAFLWPNLRGDSRVVDSAVSRLRERMSRVGVSEDGPQIRSIRRFGYIFSPF